MLCTSNRNDSSTCRTFFEHLTIHQDKFKHLFFFCLTTYVDIIQLVVIQIISESKNDSERKSADFCKSVPHIFRLTGKRRLECFTKYIPYLNI